MLSLQQPLLVHPETLQRLELFNERLQKSCKDIFQQEDIVFCVHDAKRKHFHAFNVNHPMAFSEKHSLVYFAKQHPQGFSVQDSAITEHIPEVMLLDIQLLLQQYQFTYVIPLGAADRVYGFVFLKAAPTTKDLEVKLTEFQKQFGYQLEEMMRYDSVVLAAQTPPGDSNEREQIPVPCRLLKASVQQWPITGAVGLFVLLNLLWLYTVLVKNAYPGVKFWFEFSHVYGIMALWGAFCGMYVYTQWRKYLYVSRALLMFSIGLLFQEFGQISYAVYSYLWDIQIPYPTIGDIGFFGSVIFYLMGIIFLAKGLGIQWRLQSLKNILAVIIVPTAVLIIGYMLFLQGYTVDLQQPIKTILDIAYPLSQAMYVSLAILTYVFTRDRGGVMKNHVLMILGVLAWQFLCDYVFLYQASRGTWSDNGFNDYMYLVSYFAMTLAILGFGRVRVGSVRYK